ncbi:hypothetical protein IWX49DRAFT_341172 [Phyllosticta citricarpa]|uniref:Uncharacterized protein n=1 Tax=Phyllosticta paracitricarpa TaxID=2016321 RepID=A0ABR1NBV8_9PEZI
MRKGNGMRAGERALACPIVMSLRSTRKSVVVVASVRGEGGFGGFRMMSTQEGRASGYLPVCEAGWLAGWGPRTAELTGQTRHVELTYTRRGNLVAEHDIDGNQGSPCIFTEASSTSPVSLIIPNSKTRHSAQWPPHCQSFSLLADPKLPRPPTSACTLAYRANPSALGFLFTTECLFTPALATIATEPIHVVTELADGDDHVAPQNETEGVHRRDAI